MEKETKTKKEEKKVVAKKKTAASSAKKTTKAAVKKTVKKSVAKKTVKKATKEEKGAVKKAKAVKKDTDEAVEKKPAKKKKYYEAVGRRKTSVARVRLWTAHPSESAESGEFVVNEKKHSDYFPTPQLVYTSEVSLRKMKSLNRFKVSVRVKGGGIAAQAEAIRHGIARALVKFDMNFRKKLKRVGYMTRDSRMKERKKPGLRRARRAPQWSKR